MGLIELLVVLGFALAWGVVELVRLRGDKKKAAAAEAESRANGISKQ